ncbi:hypothetical protein [Moraxella lacunata]
MPTISQSPLPQIRLTPQLMRLLNHSNIATPFSSQKKQGLTLLW